jgi:hypothetical protein
VVVSNGATAGNDSVIVSNASGYSSAESATAFTVAGPVITATSPAKLAAGAPVGTVITITGTGFTSSLAGGITHFTGVLADVSATTATFTLTATGDATARTDVLGASETVSAGNSVAVAPFNIVVDAAPTVSGTVNKATGLTPVGAGAVAVPITISGTGFQTGVTVGSFKNAYGVADPGVTATVTSVNAAGTAITAAVTIGASDANLSDSFVITNPDTGAVTASAFGTGLFIAAAPTITAVTPATGVASGTTTFAITGTNFASGATVVTSPSNGTCGAVTFTSSTSLSVTCTLGVAETTATSLLVTNPNGGQVTSAPILAAVTVVSVTPYTTGESGNGTAGKTVSIHVTGAGFYGQPKVSAPAGIKAVVSADSGSVLTVRVTVPAKVGGERTLTFTEPNGDVFKANFKA